MKPSYHVSASFSISLAFWLFFRSLPAAVICFATGVFLDIDHAIDYLANFGWRGFSFKKCYDECVHDTVRSGKFKFKKLYMVFHSVEFAIALWFIAFYTGNIYIFAFMLGYLSHLAMDIAGNREFVRRSFYFFSWRLSRKFWTAKVMTGNTLRKNPHLEVN